jgi:enoyl-CoA hydratase/carnithine racemase
MDGGVADVRLNRPDKRNALDGAMFLALAEAGERLKAEPGVRCVVLSGEGASFCAGLDFGSFQQMAGGSDAADDANAADAAQRSGSPATLEEGRITHLGQQVAWVWQEVPVPVIAAVHGHALGGGIQIALGADIRIVHPDAQLSVREVHWGLVPDMTGTLTLSRLVRPDVAKELTFTGRMVSGREAFDLGLAPRGRAGPRRRDRRPQPSGRTRGQGPLQPHPVGGRGGSVRAGAGRHRVAHRQLQSDRGRHGQLRQASAGLHRPHAVTSPSSGAGPVTRPCGRGGR